MALGPFNWKIKTSYPALKRINVPVGRWFQVQALYKCAGDMSGEAIVWEDGVKLFEVHNVQTRYAADNGCGWSVNNYSDGLNPSPATIYIDDAEIFTTGPTN